MTKELKVQKITLPKDLDDQIYRAILEGRFDDEKSLILSAIEELLLMEVSNLEISKSNKNGSKYLS